MNEKEYQKIVRKAEQGKILIGIEPALARQFFTATIPTKKVQEVIEEPIYFERYLVKVVWLLEQLFLLLNFVASIFLFKWYSIVIISPIFIIWFFLGGWASMGKQRIIFPIIVLLIGFFMAYYFGGQGIWFQIWVASLGVVYFFTKLKYWLSVSFARLLAYRNYKFFSQFLGKMIFLKEVNQ